MVRKQLSSVNFSENFAAAPTYCHQSSVLHNRSYFFSFLFLHPIHLTFKSFSKTLPANIWAATIVIGKKKKEFRSKYAETFTHYISSLGSLQLQCKHFAHVWNEISSRRNSTRLDLRSFGEASSCVSNQFAAGHGSVSGIQP